MQQTSLNNILKSLDGEKDFVFLETKRITDQEYKSFLFRHPLMIVSCRRLSDVHTSLSEIEQLLDIGYFAAGFFSYEAGFAFEEVLDGKVDRGFPLLWFGIYKEPVVFDHRKVRFLPEYPKEDYSLENLKLSLTEKEYIDAVKDIKSYIEKGETYQVNYTFKQKFDFKGSITDFYLTLRDNQSVSYSALMRFGNRYIISLSPELFFRKKDRSITVKPMKGTANRGRSILEDRINRDRLRSCLKNRSENIMIVDLLRNDLGRVCTPKTIGPKRLFEIEGYESVLQMTSTVRGRLKPHVSLNHLFKAIFPSGSVTGAPKIRTMQLIDGLEKEPRRIYTGSIGFLAPKKDAVFNVAIRTALIDTKKGKGEMGIGSGVVYDSDPKREYEECKLKSQFLHKRDTNFSLIETMLWDAKRGFPLIEIHLQRLSESAAYFSFPYDTEKLLRQLRSLVNNFDIDQRYKVRLLLDYKGNFDIYSSVIEPDISKKSARFSLKRIVSDDVFFFHKTTRRHLYDYEYRKVKEQGLYDLIFLNNRGEVTEGAISNVFIKKRGTYYTPPVECGLINGVYRRYLIQSRVFRIKEKVLYKKDLKTADAVFLTNAVRGMVKVELV